MAPRRLAVLAVVLGALACSRVTAQTAGPVINHGGTALSTPHAALLVPSGPSWVDPGVAAAYLSSAVSGPYLSAATPYGVGPGTFDGSFSLPDLSATDGGTIGRAIESGIAAGTVPPAVSGRLYVVLLPAGGSIGAGIASVVCNGCSAHYDYDGLAIVVIADGGVADPANWAYRASHELVEAATDPIVGTGWRTENGLEVADLCDPRATWVGGLPYAAYSVAGTCETGYGAAS